MALRWLAVSFRRLFRRICGIQSLYSPLKDNPKVAGRADSNSWPFRLIELSPGAKGDQIKSRLIVSTIGREKDKYETLSYLWGHENAVQPILINGLRCRIRKNLAEALLSLRHPHQSRLIWIDALSINQNDVEERSKQVARMADIYSSASRTVVYLGAKTELTPIALDFIMTLNRVDYSSRTLTNILRSEARSRDWTAVGQILENPYWTRIWIAQEVAVSADLILQIGSYTFPFEPFMNVFTQLVYVHVEDIHKDVHIRLPRLELNAVWAVLEARRRYHSKCPPELHELLVLFLSSQASDPKDKIYGLYSMCAAEWYESMPPPDYKLPLAVVFVVTLQAIIKGSGSLDILSALNPPCTSPFLPSWCPNWIAPSPASMPSMDPVWNCSGGRRAEVNFPNDRVMRTKGFLFHTDYLELGVDAASAEKIEAALTSPRGSPYGEARERRIAMLDTLLLDAPANVLLKIQFALKARIEDRDVDQMKNKADVYSTWFIRRLLEEGPNPWLDGQGCRMLRNVAKHRAFAISKQGYMCMLPETALPGDELVILLGGRVPFCVRQAECGEAKVMRRFIGDCYVHGIMHGEAMELLEGHTRTERHFDFI